MRGTVTVILSCLHTATFSTPAPMKGEKVWCYRCGSYRPAVEAPHDYTVRCLSCTRLDRNLGNAEVTADTLAVKHASRYAGHRVVLIDGETQIQEYWHAVIPVAVDVPPF